MITRRSRASPSARQVRKSAPAHQIGIEMKEEKTKGKRPGSGKARFGATVRTSATAAAASAARLIRSPAFPEPRRRRRRRGRRRRPGWPAGRPRRRATASVPRPVCSERSAASPKRDAEREGQLPVGEQGDDPGREPERRPARLGPPVVADQAVEEVGGGDHRQHPDHLRPDQRRRGREQQAVVERVVAAVPAAVPDRETGVLEELGVEDLGGEVADLRVPDQHQGRQRRAQRDRGQPFGAVAPSTGPCGSSQHMGAS